MKKELTPDKAYEIHTKIVSLANFTREQARRLVFEMGKLLKVVKEKKLYEKLGYDTFASYVADPEIGLTEGNANHYIRVYETFIERLKIKEKELEGIAFNRLLRLVPLLNEGKKPEEWLEKAKALSESDFIFEIKNAKGELGEVKVPFPKMYRCKDCGEIVIDLEVENICECGKNDAWIDYIIKKYGKKNER